MPTFHTVVPIHHVDLGPQARFEFADGLLLMAIPPWVSNQRLLSSLSAHGREGVQHARYAFGVSYEAAGLGDPDPAWVGADPKSIQESKYELCVLGNLALWLSRPSPVCFTVVIHASQFDTEPVAQQVIQCSPLLCHRHDDASRVDATDAARATSLHLSLVEGGRESAVWTAARATWAALQMASEPIRYSLFWIALEALFGPEDAREITYRLSQRVAFLMASNRAEARTLFETVKKGYGFRSKIVHGRWKEAADSETRMAEIENLVRRALVRVLEDEQLRNTFSGKAREVFLDELVFRDIV